TVRAWVWRRQLKPGPRGGVRVFEGPGSPCVTGVMSSVIAVSKTTCESFTEEQWRWLLAHEGEHVRGRDAAVAWLFGWVRAWLWWNPFVHQLMGQWSQAREEVCDAVAVGDSDSGGRYADFLLSVVSRHPSSAAFAMAASRPARRLRARLLALLESRRVCDRVGTGFMAMALIVAMGGVALVSCSGVEEGAIEPAKVTPKSAPDGAMKTFIADVPEDLATMLGWPSERKTALAVPGVKISPGGTAGFDAKTRRITIKDTEANAQRILASVANMAVMPQVYIQTKLIEAGKMFGEDGQLYDDAHFQVFIRSLTQTKGVNLLSAPSLTTKMNMRAIVEVGSERPGHADQFAGIRCEILPSPAPDGAVKIKTTITLAQEEGKSLMPDRSDAPVDWSKVKQWQQDAPAVMKHGQTRAVHVGETEKGRFVTAFITVRAINPKGNDVSSGFTDRRELEYHVVSDLPEEKTKPADVRKVDGGFNHNLTPRLKAVRLDPKTTETAKAAASARVYLSAKTVEGELPLAGSADGANPKEVNMDALFAFQKPAGDDPATVVFPAPGVATLSGVLTDPQLQVVIRALAQKKGLQLTSLPSGAVKPGEALMFKTGDENFDVTPVIGPDGYTIDLKLLHAGKQRGITTAVTIWDGQTLVMNELLSEDKEKKTGRCRIFMLTAKIINLVVNPPKQAK
ncbi:MAG: Regulatory sensor-transducer, BlaR1/MecR1 family, partial [Prosthecobacter sp.]|nr:Regulatory sensor-transducer, BlaR1/MecR1 family [Prosthecobacter sp.]